MKRTIRLFGFICLSLTALGFSLHSQASCPQNTDCLDVTASLGDRMLVGGDSLALKVRIQDLAIEGSIDVDVFVSILLPDRKTEAFLVYQEEGIGIEMGGSDPATWVPIVSNFELTEGLDSGQVTVFEFPITGNEGNGSYEWIVRLTDAGTTNIVQQSESNFFINHVESSTKILGPMQAEIGASISFQVDPNQAVTGANYDWSISGGDTSTGTTITRSFDEPGRYLVELIESTSSPSVEIREYHHINIVRPYEQTIYPFAGTDFLASATEVLDFSWNDCESDWNVYYGKHVEVWMEASSAAEINKQQVINLLLYSDYLHQSYSEIFGWDLLPSYPASRTYACENTGGAGTGTAGTFINSWIMTQQQDELVSGMSFEGLVHELIHLWDFRGGAWLNGSDTAHSFTGGMEPILNYLLETGQPMTLWAAESGTFKGLAPNYIFNHYFRVMMSRYLSHGDLSWESYYGEEFLATDYFDLNIPEHKEHMLVQGGILMSLFNMHGAEGLKRIFLEVEKTLQANPQWIRGTDYIANDQQIQVENFMKAVADALELDVSSYFEYWKYPVSTLESYMSQYSASDKINDKDGDGFSPLQMDLDDEDASVFPYAPELIDGKDNNQDGLIDENVYTEDSGDFAVKEISLPAAIHGDISSLEDEDTFQFTLTEETVVYFSAYSADSDSAVPFSPDSNREISIFAGTLDIHGWPFTVVHDQMSAPAFIMSRRFSAGTYSITMTTENEDNRNSNPGSYEIQVFVNNFEAGLSVSQMLDAIYP